MPVSAGLYRSQKLPFGPRLLDTSNPLSVGLAFGILFNEYGSTTIYDPVAGQNLSLAGSAAWTLGQTGPVMNFPAAASSDISTILAPSDTPYLGALTIICRGVIRTGSAYNAFVGKVTSNGSQNNPFDFRTTNDATPKLAFVRATTGSGDFREYDDDSAVNLVTLNASHTFAVTTPNGNCNQAPTFYVDGIGHLSGTSSGSATAVCAGNTYNIQIGRRPDGAVQLDGTLDYIYIWSRALSAPEVLAITYEPFSIWQTLPVRRWISAPTGFSIKPVTVMQAVNRAATY